MNRKVYVVMHYYATDGGFGDAVPVEDIVAVFASKDAADKFAKRWSNPHVYDKPYAELSCGILQVVEYDLHDSEDDVCPENPWWITKN